VRRMAGDDAWERLGEAARASRRREGPALIGDFAAAQTPVSWDDLLMAVHAASGDRSPEHFHRAARHVAARVPGATFHEITGASHGVHLSHPDAFAQWIDDLVLSPTS